MCQFSGNPKSGIEYPKLSWFVLALLLLASCSQQPGVTSKPEPAMPLRMLWAWERAEDLRFLDPNEFGVAFLAQTLVLREGGVDFRPRRQPLEVKPNIYLIAVTRIETKKTLGAANLSAEQREKVVKFVKNTLELPNVSGVQIDFDALVSERDFYRDLLQTLKKSLPDNTPLTMTALASWCVGDGWFRDLPVDEAVPMVFVMGADTETIRDFLKDGNDWREPLCRQSYGFSVDEPPVHTGLFKNRRIYYFKSSAWEQADINRINSDLY